MNYQNFSPRNFQQIPTVVKYILIINVALFALKSFIPALELDRWLDLFPIGDESFKPHQFITYMFMHASVSHIFLNMLAVYMFGSILEGIWGTKRFLNFYIICGLGAAALQVLINQFNHDFAILLGASGSVFGLLVAFAMMFPNTELNIYFVLPVKAKYVVGFYALYELYGAFRANDNIGHVAHLGGLITGVIIMLIWKKNRNFFF